MRFGSLRWLTEARALTVVPKRAAMELSVSPNWTRRWCAAGTPVGIMVPARTEVPLTPFRLRSGRRRCRRRRRWRSWRPKWPGCAWSAVAAAPGWPRGWPTTAGRWRPVVLVGQQRQGEDHGCQRPPGQAGQGKPGYRPRLARTSPAKGSRRLGRGLVHLVDAQFVPRRKIEVGPLQEGRKLRARPPMSADDEGGRDTPCRPAPRPRPPTTPPWRLTRRPPAGLPRSTPPTRARCAVGAPPSGSISSSAGRVLPMSRRPPSGAAGWAGAELPAVLPRS